MELEFDKEIDTILRKARSGIGATVGADAGHLDADTISAFAENALPDKSKLLYVKHFADCDKCRKQLSHTILMNNEADVTTASSDSALGTEAAIPWYQTILRTPNLALAMGALVLAFSSILGYLVLQNKNETANSDVSQVTEPQRGGPYYNGESGAAMANAANTAAANSAMSPANTTANSSPNSPNSTAKAPGVETGRLDSVSGSSLASNTCQDCGAPGDDKDKTGKANEKPVAAAPPPSFTTDGVAVEPAEKKADAEKKKESQSDSTLSMRKQSEDRGSRDMPDAASKSGPARSGPMQNKSNQVNNNIADMPVTRLVGGKRFENRNGAWYDSAYHGQATINVRRSSDEYKKLDKGIRNIAGTLGGTVVVVWKEKAYRVQ